jgi:hypothetical protein
MPRAFIISAVFGLLATPALADPSQDDLVAKAATLLGKSLTYEKQQAIFDKHPHAASDDWTLRLDVGEEGELVRSADVAASNVKGGDGPLLTTETSYERRCEAKTPSLVNFTLGDDGRLLGKVAPPRTVPDLYLRLSRAGAHDAPLKKTHTGFSWDSGAYEVELPLADLTAAEALAACRTAAYSPKTCLDFSLKGFARAYRYVCEAR